MPQTKQPFPRPIHLLNKKTLFAAWSGSRDAKRTPGTAGFDKQSAASFAAELDNNLNKISNDLRAGRFGFGPLRPKLIPKGNQGKFRLICVPSVRDRLVQRAIADVLSKSDRLSVANSGSFGFVKGKTLRQALKQVIEYRSEYSYVFETDIQSFFDQIQRGRLKQLVRTRLGSSSLVPLLYSVIDCEIKASDDEENNRIGALGIQRGLGLRQGMPLSPVLANLALRNFDLRLAKEKIPVVRYADDVVTFARTEEDAHKQMAIVVGELEKAGHSVPPLEEGGKTNIVGPQQSFSFLGREFYFSNKYGVYRQRVSDEKLAAILSEILKSSSVDKLIKDNVPFSSYMSKLSGLGASYMATYSDAANADRVHSEIIATARSCIKNLFEEMFGETAVSKLSRDHRRYLQIDGFKLTSSEVDDFDEY